MSQEEYLRILCCFFAFIGLMYIFIHFRDRTMIRAWENQALLYGSSIPVGRSSIALTEGFENNSGTVPNT